MARSVLAVLGAAFAMVLLVLSTEVAAAGEGGGIPPFEVDVTGEARCLASGEAEVTWTAVASFPPQEEEEVLAPVGLRPTGLSQAGVRFEGDQSGAASGPVAFDPDVVFVPATEESFPQSSQALAIVPGNGGTVTLEASVTIFLESEPQVSRTESGVGSVDLPVCEQPLVDGGGSAPSTAAAAEEAATRPRFTG